MQAGPLTLYLCMLTVCMAGLQFTELQQKEQMAKLAMARNDLASAPSARKFKFISAVNDQVKALSLCSCMLRSLRCLCS